MVPVAAGMLAVLVGTAVPVKAADHLAEARGYYNQELFELAMKAASAAREDETLITEKFSGKPWWSRMSAAPAA